jgi:hypothetical protein
VLAPTLWMNTGRCFVEAVGNGSFGLTPMSTSSITPVSAVLVVQVRDRAPLTPGKVLRLGNIEIKVGTTGTWHIVQGASDVDTGSYVSAVPVALGVTIAGGLVSMFVDGEEVGSAAFAQGGTGWSVGGDNAEVIWKSAAARLSALSSSDISALSLAMRARAKLPTMWPLVVLSGQSNAVDSSGHFQNRGAMLSGMRNCPGWAYKSFNSGAVTSNWLNGVANEISSGDFAGVNSGWIAASQLSGYPCAVLGCAKGGAHASEWLEGGAMRAHVETAVAQAFERFGTHLVKFATWLWIQGEGDAGTSGESASYQSKMELIRSWLHDTWGQDIRWVGVRLSEYVTNATEPFADVVRAQQDAFAASYSDVVYITPTDDPSHFSDALHYHWWQQIVLGQRSFEEYESEFGA